MRRLVAAFLTLVLFGAKTSTAQKEGILQLDAPLHRFLDKQQTLGHLPDAHLSHQPLAGYAAAEYLDSLDRNGLSVLDRRMLERYRGDRDAPGAKWVHEMLGFLYANGHDLYAARGDDYAVQVNPLLHMAAGPASGSNSDSETTWHYDRGIRVSGHVTDYVFFEGRLTEGARQPVWSTIDNLTAARYGHVGPDTPYEYFTSTGHLGVRFPHLELRLARDHSQWGPGATSLVLSDHATVYDHVQLRATLGKAQYTTVLAGLTEPRLQPEPLDVIEPRKYAAFHRLSLNLPARVNLSLFEAVVFGTDSLGARTGFDWSYVNPLVFYRGAERDRGSPDNILLGGSLSWIATSGLRLYGEFVLDELDVSRIGKKWWGNKWGWTLGAHVVPASTLSIRTELSRLRPFLYSHEDARGDYIHYLDVLGHPAGPNSWDVALLADFQPTMRVHAALNAAYTVHGRNDGGVNTGADPLLPNVTRPREFGYEMLAGIRQNRLLFELYGGYELLPQLYLEAALIAESLDDAERGCDWYVAPQLQVRWGMPFQSLRY